MNKFYTELIDSNNVDDFLTFYSLLNKKKREEIIIEIVSNNNLDFFSKIFDNYLVYDLFVHKFVFKLMKLVYVRHGVESKSFLILLSSFIDKDFMNENEFACMDKLLCFYARTGFLTGFRVLSTFYAKIPKDASNEALRMGYLKVVKYIKDYNSRKP
jgi:hypothetical protein